MLSKTNLIKACPGVLLAVFLLLSTQLWAPACGLHSDGTYSTCHYAQVMVLGIGLLMLLSALALLLSKDARGISLVLLAEAVLLMLTPKVIIPLCKMSSMKCLKSFYPVVILFGVLFILYAIILFGTSFIRPKKKRGE